MSAKFEHCSVCGELRTDVTYSSHPFDQGPCCGECYREWIVNWRKVGARPGGRLRLLKAEDVADQDPWGEYKHKYELE